MLFVKEWDWLSGKWGAQGAGILAVERKATHWGILLSPLLSLSLTLSSSVFAKWSLWAGRKWEIIVAYDLSLFLHTLFSHSLSRSWHLYKDYVYPCVMWTTLRCFSQDTCHRKYSRKNYKTLMEVLKQFLTSSFWKQSIISIEEIGVNKFYYYPWQGEKRWIWEQFLSFWYDTMRMTVLKFSREINVRWHTLLQ